MKPLLPQFSVAFQTNKSQAEYRELASLAEGYGFGTVSVYNDLGFQPAIPALLAMAEVTDRVRLGPACLNPFTLHPVEIAGQMAVLNAVSGGRAYLGLSRGAWLESIGLNPVRPVQALREAIGCVRSLLSGQPSASGRTLFPLADEMRLRYETSSSIFPILIGTWGDRTTRLAGEVADEVKIGGSANPRMVELTRQRLAAGAAGAGRAGDETGIVMGAVTVVDSDRAGARALARREVALYLPVVAPLDPFAAVEPELLGRITAAVARSDVQSAAELISDDLLDIFAFAGTPDDIAARTRELLDAGATRVEYGTPHGLTAGEGLKLLGERVLPQFRADQSSHGAASR